MQKVDNSQITRLTWRGMVQPNYGGNTFINRAIVIANQVRSRLVNLTDFKCYTFNALADITEQFYAKVNEILYDKAK